MTQRTSKRRSASAQHPRRRQKQSLQKHLQQRPSRVASVPQRAQHKLRIIPLGGLEEVGKNMTLFEVQDALVKVQTNQNLVLLYKNTVIPQAEQTLQSTVAAYQTGKTEFLMLIDAYRMLLMAKLDYYMSVMSHMASQAQLEQAVGMDISEISAQVQ